MRILLLGGTGQVGWELQRALAPLGEVVVLGREGEGGLCGDLERPEGLRQAVRRLAPAAIVNAAAYTAVDQAEAQPERAERINAEAPGVLAEEAARLGAWLVHYSTDYVFDGSGSAPWCERDEPAPLNAYGATKWRGEQAVRQAGGRHLIFRTEWVYAARGKNFIRTMLQLAGEREALQVIDDQFGAPTGAELIADVTAHALASTRQRPGLTGTYHLTAGGETTWHGYASFVIERARAMGRPVRVAPEAVTPVPTEAFPTKAFRPRNSRLDCQLLEQAFGLQMPDWRQGVERVLTEIESQEGKGQG